MANQVYEQLEFDIEVPCTRVWAVYAGEEYGYYWSDYTNIEEYLHLKSLSRYPFYPEWIEDESGNVISGQYDEWVAKRYPREDY